MQPPLLHPICGQQLWVSPAQALYWEEQQALILSDLHMGKTGHFRKSGIPVPQQVFKEDLLRLVGLIQHFQPRQLIIVGDMFHSQGNKELGLFEKWREDLAHLKILLVKGNHDILEKSWYDQHAVEVFPGRLTIPPFGFVHDNGHNPTEKEEGCRYTFSGHRHPGVLLTGNGKQSLRFPCFYFGESEAILPAFSAFTGLSIIAPRPGDVFYAVADQSLIVLK